MTIELKPCPFCGEAPTVIDCDETVSFYVECENEECGIRPFSDSKGTRIEAVEIWNTRAVQDVPELVRYRLNSLGELVYSENGSYVLYSQAAEIIAAERAEKEKLILASNDMFKTAVVWQERAKAAEAKLAQMEKQS